MVCGPAATICLLRVLPCIGNVSDVSMSTDQDDETAAALRPRHGSLLRPPAHHSQEVRQHPSGESQHHHNLTFILYTWRCVQKQGAGGPPYPMWHLEPLYVRKVTPSPSKRSVAKVQEQRSVFSSLDGDQHSLQQQMEQGQNKNTANDLDLASTSTLLY